MPRRVEGSSKRKFIKKKGKRFIKQKGASALRQERSLESASKWPKIFKLRNTRRAKGLQKFIQSRDERQPKKKKARQAEIPKRRFKQKLGLMKRRRRRKEKLENPTKLEI